MTTPDPVPMADTPIRSQTATMRAEAALALTQQQERTQALRREVHLLAESLRADVQRLDNVVAAQGSQVEGSLARLERLSTERVEAVRREAGTAHTAAESAIDRAERQAAKRLDDLAALFDGHLQEINIKLGDLAMLKASERLQQERVNDLRRESSTAVETLRREANDHLASATKAIDKAESATEKRFEAVNEFRAQLSDQAALFMPREVAEAQIAELRNQVARVVTRLDQNTGRSQGQTQTVAYVVTAATIALTIVIFLANYLTTH